MIPTMRPPSRDRQSSESSSGDPSTGWPVPVDTDDERLVFQTAVMLSTEEAFVLGASVWIEDGEVFVATDKRLPLDADVEVAFVLPERDRTIQMDGQISFWHDGGGELETDRVGMGVAIDPEP